MSCIVAKSTERENIFAESIADALMGHLGTEHEFVSRISYF